MTENWGDEYARDLLRPLCDPQKAGHIPYEDLDRFRYTQKGFSELCMMRSHLMGWQGKFEEEDGYFVMPVDDSTGRAGASIHLGSLKAEIFDENARMFLQLFGVPAGVRYEPKEWVLKSNNPPQLNDIEWAAYDILTRTPGTNVAPIIRRADGKLEVRHQDGPTLFQEVEHLHRLRTLYGNQECFAPARQRLLATYAKLASESAHSAAALTGHLSDDTRRLAADLNWHGIAAKRGISIEEAKQRFAGQYQTRKVMDAYGITDESFVDAFAPIQGAINEYAAKHSVWISDRSPKNRKGKNYDFNKIDFAPLTRELTLILDMHPEGLDHGERLDIFHKYLDRWNDITGQRIKPDEEFQRSYAAEMTYRALLNARHSLADALKHKQRQVCCTDFYRYARLAEQGRNYLEHLVKSGLEGLEEFGTLKRREAEAVMGHVRPAFERYSDEVGAAMAYRDLTPQQNLALDARIYYLKQPESWEHVEQHRRREQQQKGAQASTASSHSS